MNTDTSYKYYTSTVGGVWRSAYGGHYEYYEPDKNKWLPWTYKFSQYIENEVAWEISEEEMFLELL